ncbi:TonB-dependent receptor [Massilia sp. DJPM01]|uniref:TonB-dependent receptor domain-containing protein n=1 Tax=Massilia sp. DJPM01 TaxID=3024404 RepID=UPI00259F49DE|nr:TonB-dependent receptor [Massilia sp. DJPM01]MDM5179695.1 TonB-dependent receptor [Massilia sp. DJPM01]
MNASRISCSLRRLVAGGGGASLALLPFAVQAQAPAPPGPMPRVEITGTHIPRATAETAAAVITLNRNDIERSGKTTVAELLQTLAVDNQGSVPSSFGGGFASGASGISLRGLGAASTLVLLNGRRVAPYGLADDGQKMFSDLNIIPADAVERIDVLKNGASAIYGSDAIAGVVNVILRRDFHGTTLRASFGQSRERDGNDGVASLTWGGGDLQAERYNVLASLEYGRRGAIWNRDRAGRGHIGRGDLRDWGFSAQESLGGTGAITASNTAGSAINGNVRNPATLDYYNRGNLAGAGFTRTFPGAACAGFTSHPQGDPAGGCLIDAAQRYNQIQPSQERINFFGRATLQATPRVQAYAELNLYRSVSASSSTPSAVSGAVGYPGGPVNSAAVALGPAHPDNPYFGTAARLRYMAADIGPRMSQIDSDFVRLLAGAKATLGPWEVDTALLFSQNQVSNERSGYPQRDVAFALLNPGPANVAAASANPAYAALAPGSVWRIAENAALNPPALYAALAPARTNDARSRIAQADLRASRQLAELPGGALGVAIGADFRHESAELAPTPGTERGNVIGLGYSAYKGSRNVAALYGEELAPVHPALELSAALRADHYTDAGDSYTPKFGVKWTPLRTFALRGTYARGFRAPSTAENGVGGLAAYSTSVDPLRCSLGVEIACNPAQVAIITSPNPALSPEKSRSVNVGMVWDPYRRTTVSLDLWEIKRKNDINQEQSDAAILAGRIARDPSGATWPGDPGPIAAVLASYVNSARTQVRGADLDLRQRFDFGPGSGEASMDARWTHLFKWQRTEQDGSTRDYAGTHGNCDVTNCIGTPDDRVNFRLSWERAAWRVSANVNYRGAIKHTLFKNDPAACASHFADGNPAPADCELPSFTTVDLSLRWKPAPRIDVFGSAQNIVDQLAPLDPLTYGATAYNPLDHAGAVGRFFTAGVRYTF